MKITQIQCPSCLGQLTVDWETGKAVCQYCLTKSVLHSPPKQTQEASNEQAPVVFQEVKEGFYSFTFNEDEVANALKKWLIQQESVPEDIVVHLEVSEVKRYFIPIYEFQVTYTMQWEGPLATIPIPLLGTARIRPRGKRSAATIQMRRSYSINAAVRR